MKFALQLQVGVFAHQIFAELSISDEHLLWKLSAFWKTSAVLELIRTYDLITSFLSLFSSPYSHYKAN